MAKQRTSAASAEPLFPKFNQFPEEITADDKDPIGMEMELKEAGDDLENGKAETDGEGTNFKDDDETSSKGDGSTGSETPRSVSTTLSELNAIMDAEEEEKYNNILMGYHSTCPPPQILFACRESHGVASKFYKQAFGSFGSVPQTYFNFDLDILYISVEKFNKIQTNLRQWDLTLELIQGDLEQLGNLEDFQKVRNLAILPSKEEFDLGFEDSLGYLLGNHFPITKQLTIIVEDHDPERENTDILFIDPVDVDVTLSAYELFEPKDWQPDEEVPMEESLSYREVDENTLTDFYEGRSENPPTIEYKMLITRDVQNDLDSAREECEERLAAVVKNYEELAGFPNFGYEPDYPDPDSLVPLDSDGGISPEYSDYEGCDGGHMYMSD
ncbi:hypothetical protein G7Y89_g13278 [Cudoniella acicularis]|uniref:2EXR domain-containing protein n=1 Tax=Cudoniella acicularis TaxID=354080 RepID=A0A8H4R7L1_9HELO|nr:hypothetical protein G7Y89_g13278 [Cudoniella acicularis]